MYLAYQSDLRVQVLYFIFVVLIGKIILLNLFLAILLGNFEHASQIIWEEQEEKLINEFKSTMNKIENDDLLV